MWLEATTCNTEDAGWLSLIVTTPKLSMPISPIVNTFGLVWKGLPVVNEKEVRTTIYFLKGCNHSTYRYI